MPAKLDASSLIEEIYAAAVNPEAWEQLFPRLALHFRSESAGMWVHARDLAARASKMVGAIDDAQMAFYNQHLADKNPWYQIPGLMRPGCALTDTTLEILQNDRHAFTRTAFYQDWIKGLGLRHVLGGTLRDASGNHLNFTFLRSARAGVYTKAEIAQFTKLSRHVARAVDIGAQIEAHRWAQQVAEHSLNQLGIGVAIVDAARRLLFANAKAEQLIRSRTAIALRHSRLCAADTKHQPALQKAIDDIASKGGYANVEIQTSATAGVSLHLSGHVNTGSFLSAARTAVTVLIIDKRAPAVSPVEHLKSRWGLSNREAQLTELLLQGYALREAAEALSITFETARWYCKQVMRKTGVTRQSQLVAKLLTGMSA